MNGFNPIECPAFLDSDWALASEAERLLASDGPDHLSRLHDGSSLVGEYRRVMRDACERGYVDAYRAITAFFIEGRPSRVYIDRLGLYWSWDRREAQPIWGVRGRYLSPSETFGGREWKVDAQTGRPGALVVLAGRIPVEGIDWAANLKNFARFPDESEITVLPNSPVLLRSLDVSGEGEAGSSRLHVLDPPIWGNSGPAKRQTAWTER